MLGTRDERMTELQAEYPLWEPMSIWERFSRCAARHGQREFLAQEDRHATYDQVFSEVERVAAHLGALGVEAGSGVIVHLKNRIEFVVATLAIARQGAVKVLANSSSAADEVAMVARMSGASLLITDAQLSFGDAVGIDLAIVVADGQVDGVPAKAWEALLSACPVTASCAVDPDSVCDLMFTSGSTGSPKCVPLTHDQLQRSAYSNALNRGFEVGRVLLVLVPFCHCFGYVEALLSALFVGAKLVFSPHRASARDIVEVASGEAVNDMLAMPYTVASLCDHLERDFDALPALHALYCAGERASVHLYERARRLLGVEDVVNGYGMTEVCGATMQSVPGDSPSLVCSRVGHVMPAGSAGLAEFGGALVGYRIVRADGSVAKVGETGSVQVRGITLTRGYLRAPEANARDFTDDGWFCTGDVGRFDDAGYLEFIGREKESYRFNGENVSPSFVESVIERCPGVARAVVVGVSNPRFGQVGCAFVQFDERVRCDLGAVRAWFDGHLASFQIPKYLVPMAESDWVRTESGKVRRPELVAAFERGDFAGRCVSQSFEKRASAK